MPRTPRIFALLSGLFCATLAGLAAYLLFGPQWGWDIELDRTVYQLRQQLTGEPWINGTLIGIGVTGALGALGSLLMTLRPPPRMLRYPIEHGQVLIPLPVVRQVADDVLASHPEVVSGEVKVLRRRKGPELTLKLRVLDSTVFAQMSDTLRRQLKTEIGSRTGVIIQEIRMRITVTHDADAEVLPPDVPDREPAIHAPDFSEIDLDLGVANHAPPVPGRESTIAGGPAAPEPAQPIAPEPPPHEPVGAPAAQPDWSEVPPPELEPALPQRTRRWPTPGEPDRS